ncbi:MAG: GDP-mannose mannosyl hydrolase [Desulfuromonas sp.]
MAEINGWLDTKTFHSVVASTPLISIDLLVENEHGEFLLGLRINRPAQGYWFVPGGRVQKNETMDAAFKRLTRIELGLELERSAAQFIGVYEHFYSDSVFGSTPGTHYIVLAYHVKINACDVQLSADQHTECRWFDAKQIIADAKVHQYSQAYIKDFI